MNLKKELRAVMYKTISSSPLNPVIKIPTSKSYANRALILAALSNDNVIVSDIPESSDVKDMVNVLEKLSLLKRVDDSEVVLNKSFPESEVESNSIVELDLGEGGTTIRFLLSFLALGKNKYKIKVHPRFKNRPYLDHLNFLESLGVSINLSEEKDVLCELQGPINLSGVLKIDCSKTTQVATSFLLLKNKYQLELILENIDSSKAYLAMTNELVQRQWKGRYFVPADFSGAGYFIALGLFFQKISLINIISKDEYQADSQIFSVLEQIGADYSIDMNGLIIRPMNEYESFEVDGSKCLDLIPTLCFIAAGIKGKSTISNIENLIYKESNRLEGIKNILSAFEVEYKVEGSTIAIEGKTNFLKEKNKKFTTLPDHRLIMVSSLFIKMSGGGEVTPYREVAKSFPNFFKLLN